MMATQKGLRKGPWSGEEYRLLNEYVSLHGEGLKKGQLTYLEEGTIIEQHAILGRTDNEIKNYWRTHFGKREKYKYKKLQRGGQQPEYGIKSKCQKETINETKSFEKQNNIQPFADHINQFSKRAMQNQATFGVGGDSMQNHHKTSYFDHTYDKLFYV
ncbi:hypothetical protein VNO78_14897 [Psophocarpus tetragonolobus]|uniref:Myb-like domain-containing protein n=1 Tax=Psophocarpus tetragonolobus TaxID=3891 RepID=A0AAN9SEC1_PSOTE